MGTEEAAITMVNYYTTVTPQVRNVPVFIQYSNHKELKTDSTLNQVGDRYLCHGWNPLACPPNLVNCHISNNLSCTSEELNMFMMLML